MIDLNMFIFALKCTWVRKKFGKDGKWKSIFLTMVDIDKVLKLGNGYCMNCMIKVKNNFWRDVFKAWQMAFDMGDNSNWDYFCHLLYG